MKEGRKKARKRKTKERITETKKKRICFASSKARTLDEIKEMTGAGTGCGRCCGEIEKILSSVCGCKNVSLKAVVDSVNNGADTVEKVGNETGAGTACGRCKALIENIIEIKK